MKFKFDRAKLIEGVRIDFGKLSATQVKGLGFLLERIESDDRWETIPQISYFLATVWHETARTLKPVTEYGGRKYFDKYDTGKLARRLGNTPEADGDGFNFRGRGYVQNTGRGNAMKTGVALTGNTYNDEGGSPFTVTRDTFLCDPTLLLIPAVSYDDAVDGMFTGRYTRKKITDYISERKTNYREARRVINGTDMALLIAGLAMSFERALRAAMKPDPTPAIDAVLSIKTGDGPAKTPEPQAATPEDKVTLRDVTKHISSDSLKAMGPRILAKVGPAAGGMWGIGIHGQILLVLIIALVVGVVGYELYKHREKVRNAARDFLKGGTKEN